MKRKSWEEFYQSGLLWWINTLLHTFGWAIVVVMDKETGKVSEVYPARVKFRGFDEKTNEQGYINVSNYLKDNAAELAKEAKE